ncbi:MAG: hypothetical protein PVH95_07840 [Anaerolineae bacterium]|jgi:hypothetical protein
MAQGQAMVTILLVDNNPKLLNMLWRTFLANTGKRGPGFPEGLPSRIQPPFYELAEQQDGTISVESQEGHENVFSVTLPRTTD